MNTKRNGEKGNALLIVLIGIALFAALMFVMSRTNRYDVGGVENAALYAQQITSYANKINVAVQNVMLQNGCLDTQVSFQNTTVSGYTNPNSPSSANNKCWIFDMAGGGLSFQTPPLQAVDTESAATAGSSLAGNYLFEGNVCVTNTGTSCSAGGTALLFIMPWVTESVCAQIDQITMNTTTIPTDSAATFDGTQFTGTYANTYTIATGGTTYSSGCYQSTASPPGNGYHFYFTIVAH